ncbi:right-handed parallel beta-helix repeat-containing protein [filamentous cyanobacterium LEGE 11480]|uniref:Right-handed parallel beta-helix repeat-containing protein n=1 Tax=Romeriopsis navalis LEGE 11480 TaxID=2777977 RepID=A0A928VKN9_9CYAN|nr:lectin-like protein [Romeriopsis navalis]MBE9028300.1 right-handed parallel beta-helix repeat-containing protein [Romeriopsis navalis LEGE 11480]
MSLTLYVATDGNDFNPGTFEQPFATVQSALSTLPVGQGGTVLLRGGSYQLDDAIRVSDNEGGTAASRLVIRNFGDEAVTLDGRSLAAVGESSIVLSSTQFVDIQGLEIFGSSFGITVVGDSRDVLIQGNTVHDVARAGIAAYAPEQRNITNIQIDGNTVYRTNLFNADRPVDQPGGWDSGIVFSRTEGGAITNNTVFQNYGEGIALTLANNAFAQNNTVFDNFSVQIYMDHASNSVLENNFIFNTGDRNFYRRFDTDDGQIVERAAEGIQLANEFYRDQNPLWNNTIRNNIVVGGNTVFGYGNFLQGGGLQNVFVANNTFYANDTTQTVLEVDPDNHRNSYFFNNIFYTERADQYNFLPDNPAGLNFFNNLWFGNSPNAAASNADVYSNPLFVNPGGFDAADYRLLSNSGAIDTGATVDIVTTDFLGIQRPTGQQFDIGAYEFANAPVPSNPEQFFYNGRTYQLTSAELSWEEARAEAIALGGKLVTINDAAEESWLRQTFGQTERFWLGLNDRNAEGNFTWTGGEQSGYFNWVPGEPNNLQSDGAPLTGEDYVVMNWFSDGRWNDMPDSYGGVFRGIIEFDFDSSTPPNAPAQFAEPFTYNGRRYQLTSTVMGWEAARLEALSLGGKLVTINDAREEAWLRQTFGESERFWLGLNDRYNESNFTWTGGEQSDYFNWVPGEPNNLQADGAPLTGEDYVVMNWFSDGRWNDMPDSYGGVFRGIIEFV